MTQKLKAFALALLFLTLISAVFLGFTLGLTHPVPWVFLVLLVGLVILTKKATEKEFVTWKDEYSVGIESIDNDHKKLLSLINNLQTSTMYYTGEDFDREALDKLIEYTKFHFTREEKLMEDNDYPGFAEHKLQHKKMTDNVLNMVKEYEEDSEKTIEELVEFLKDWLIKHINGSDQKYSSYLISKGVK